MDNTLMNQSKYFHEWGLPTEWAKNKKIKSLFGVKFYEKNTK